MGLACGGTIKILVEPITKSDKCKRELLRSFYVNYREDKFSILRIDLNSNKRELLENKDLESESSMLQIGNDDDYDAIEGAGEFQHPGKSFYDGTCATCTRENHVCATWLFTMFVCSHCSLF